MWVVLCRSWPNPSLAGTGCCAAGSGKQPGPGRQASGGHFGRGRGINPGRKSCRGPGAVWDQVTAVC